MTTPVDLDHLEKLHAEATQGEWRIDEDGSLVTDRNGETFYVADCTWGDDPDGPHVAATHNALPALIAEVRALREVRDAAIGYAEIRRAPGEDEAFDEVLAALAKVPR